MEALLVSALLGIGISVLISLLYDAIYKKKPDQKRFLQLIDEDNKHISKRIISDNITKINESSFIANTVDRYSLSRYVIESSVKSRLILAGLRKESHETIYAFYTFALPVAYALIAFIAIQIFMHHSSYLIQIFAIAVSIYLGYKTPYFYVSKKISKRKDNFLAHWPDTLDMIQLCINSNISLEQSLTRIANEMKDLAPVIAEEIEILLADLSFSMNRIGAYEKFGERTDTESTREFSITLIHAEQNGTPLNQAIKTLSEQGRLDRTNKARQKAASLSAKLVLPLIVFFVPVLFMLILSPAIITFSQTPMK